MEETFDCVICGELNATLLDLDEGDHIELSMECTMCNSQNSIVADFDYHSGHYQLQVSHSVSTG